MCSITLVRCRKRPFSPRFLIYSEADTERERAEWRERVGVEKLNHRCNLEPTHVLLYRLKAES